jgi:ankyrin repeat protein
MKDHSHLTQTSLNFDEIVSANRQDYHSIYSLKDSSGAINIDAAKSLKFSNDRNVFHLGKNWNTGSVIDILLENKDHEEEIINKLREKDSRGFNPLHLAIMRDDHIILSDFLKKDPTLVFEKDSHGNSPLRLALIKNHSLIFDKLLATIIESSDKTNLEESFQLISQYLNPKERSVNNAMGSLLKKGVDINAINNDGNTALHLAALNGNLEMMNFLLNHGAKFDIKDKNGKNALELITDENQQKKLFSQAIEDNNLELVKTLFEMGFKYDEVDFLFQKAVKSGNLELISFMVKDIGIDPYECDRIFRVSGREWDNLLNPVDYAISSMASNPITYPIRDESNVDFLSKHEDIIKFFLENGALPNRDSVYRDNYPEFLDNLPPNLKEHILKYDHASCFFDDSINVTEIKRVIDSFLPIGADLESAQPITLHYYSGKETSASGETKSTITECKSIELTALGIINLHRHISFDKLKRSDENDDKIEDKIEELHKKIIESRSKSIKEKLSDSAGIAPSSLVGSRGVDAEQPSPLKRSRS